MCRHILALLSIALLIQPLRASVALQQDHNPDFDNSGVVDFPDFLLYLPPGLGRARAMLAASNARFPNHTTPAYSAQKTKQQLPHLLRLHTFKG